MSSASIDFEEKRKFAAVSQEWWNPNGKFAKLHEINPIRLGYIISQLKNRFPERKLSELKVLEIGCGGGIVCEPLSRLGINITGLDMVEENIEVAKAHAAEKKLQINYLHGAVEALNPDQHQYDAILMLEVLEHVADLTSFINHSVQLLKNPGVVIASTINRTAKSLITAKIAAEYILGWVPPETHDWHKFIKPYELFEYFSSLGLTSLNYTGLTYNLWRQEFCLNEQDLSANYFATFVN